VAAAANLSRLHPKLKTIARNIPRVARAYGFNARVTSGYRSYATQARLYREYISGRALYPVNPPGQSLHEKGLAIDVVSDNQPLLVQLMTNIGLVWAGPGDDIHFQIGTGSLKSPQTTAAQAKTSKKKKSAAKSILGAVSYVPGPVGWGASILDFLF